MVSLPTNAIYPSSNSIGDILAWQPPEPGHDPQTPEGWLRPTLPPLAANTTMADQALYQAIQEAYANPESMPMLVDRVQFGDLAPGRLAEQYGPGARYTDPQLQSFAQAQHYNATLRDTFSPWGDEFATALMGLGLATGGAGLYGGFGGAAAGGAEAIASPLPVAGLEGFEGAAASGLGAEAAGEGAGLGLGAGEAAGVTGAGGSGGLWGTGIPLTGKQALTGANLAYSGARTAQNPSGASVGGLLGAGLGAATGIPGLGVAGGLAGGAASPAEGGGQMAEGQQGQADLGQLIAAIVGLGGSGLSLASGMQGADRQNTQYNQGQQLYQLLTQLAQQYQQQQQQSYGQNQQVYGQNLSQIYPQLLQMAQQYQQQQQGAYGQTQDAYRRNLEQVYPQVAQQMGDERGRTNEVYGERQAAGQRLANPYTAQDGINTMTQGLSSAARDEVLRGIQRDAAMRGQSQGGAYQDILATALARYDLPYRQMGAQNFMNTQQLGLGQFQYAPTGPYTPQVPGAPQPPQPGGIPYTPYGPVPPQPAQFPYPGQTTPLFNSPNAGQTLAGAGGLIGNLVRALGMSGITLPAGDAGNYDWSSTGAGGSGGGFGGDTSLGVGAGVGPFEGAGVGAGFTPDDTFFDFGGLGGGG